MHSSSGVVRAFGTVGSAPALHACKLHEVEGSNPPESMVFFRRNYGFARGGSGQLLNPLVT